MDELLAILKDQPKKDFEKGQSLIRQGEKKGVMFVLISGSVEVVKAGVQICTVSEKGSIFGEISVLLQSYHNATVRALEASSFYVIEDPDKFLASNPEIALFISRLLARRLALLDSYFAELKKEFFNLTNRVQQAAIHQGGGDTEMMRQFWEDAERGMQMRRHKMP